ncbi:PrsW family intramembrane metalloprotease [Actinoplanes sp. HUAS TT8]|uniref:PrsW family intramembrane metalloprotease n=1 Tax=Actinoplanes sp. HUAS TT8 TaxID=3447453 RepID=UPI003F51B21C
MTLSAQRIIWPLAAGVALIGANTWVVTQIGVSGALAGLPVAAVVATVVVAAIRWLDRWDRERPGRLASAFLWGASFAALGAIFSQRWIEQLTDAVGGPGFSHWFHPLVITPVTEEVLKALFLVWLLVHRRDRISGLLNGIVYGGLAGAGFAFTENIYYLGGALTKFTPGDRDATTLLAVTFVLRLVLIPFMHAFLVALTGLGIAAGTRRRTAVGRWAMSAAGLLAAIVLHGLWDFAGLAAEDPYLIFKVYGALMVPLFTALLVTALILRRREHRAAVASAPGRVYA